MIFVFPSQFKFSDVFLFSPPNLNFQMFYILTTSKKLFLFVFMFIPLFILNSPLMYYMIICLFYVYSTFNFNNSSYVLHDILLFIVIEFLTAKCDQVLMSRFYPVHLCMQYIFNHMTLFQRHGLSEQLELFFLCCM